MPFCDDLPHRLALGTVPLPSNAVEGMVDVHFDYGLYLIQQMLSEYNKTLEDYALPLPILHWSPGIVDGQNSLMAEELAYNVLDEARKHEEMLAMLNPEQLDCYTKVLQAIMHLHFEGQSPSFFLHGPAGTGKTYLYKCLCSYLRANGKVVLCVASSGIAAQLLPGGRTAHSRFKIPLSNDTSNNCNMTKTSALADLIRGTSLIIWDEVSMQHKACFEAVNRTLNDICNAEEGTIFGDIPIILGGDFAQILPVVRRGSKHSTIQASVQHSSIWSQLKILQLRQNMRMIQGIVNHNYLTFLHSMVHNPTFYGELALPDFIPRVNSVHSLSSIIYPDTLLLHAMHNPNAFKGRSILSYRNETVQEFNDMLIQNMPGEMHEFMSMNSVDINDQAIEAEPLPAEYLQSINLPSLPPAVLQLKVGAPAILLRNISPKEGMCNGTRLRIIGLGRNCIKVTILGGEWDGQVRLLPRIKLTSSEEDLPFILTRKQFPIRLCFAMTVNKAQGQSLQHVGVDLRTGAFTHGQLYVALSRVTSVDGITILLSDNSFNKTTNIVYPEVLL